MKKKDERNTINRWKEGRKKGRQDGRKENPKIYTKVSKERIIN